MAVRIAASLLFVLSAVVSAPAKEPALVRSIATTQFKDAVVRPDGSSLGVTREGVINQDAAGRQRYVARLRGNQKASLARHSGVFGVTTFADNAPSTLSAFAFELYDEKGSSLFRLEKPEATEFVISDDGRWVLGIEGGDEMRQSRLHLFDARGQATASWTVPYLSDITMPAGATRFLAASNGVLQAFSYAGGEPHPIGRFELFATGDGGRYVLLCGAGSLALYQDEKLVFTSPCDLARLRCAAVSPDGQYIAVAGSDRLELFGREKGNRLWTVTSGKPELQFVSVDLAGGPDHLLAGLDLDPGAESQTGRHAAGAVFMMNTAGELVWRDDFGYTSWNVRVPAVHYHGAHRQIQVELAEEIRCYDLP